MTNQEYWILRSKEQAARIDRQIGDIISTIEDVYGTAARNICDQTERWYIKYADEEGVSLQASKIALNSGEFRDFKMTLDEYIKHGEQLEVDPTWLDAMRGASTKHHIDRMDSLRMTTQAELEQAFAIWRAEATDGLDRILTDSYLRTSFDLQKDIGVGKYINGADIQKLRATANKPWAPDGVDFVTRTGINNKKLIFEMQQQLAQGCITGASYEDLAKNLQDKIALKEYEAKRLIRTEATHVATVAERESYQMHGVKEYEFLASLDNKTCDVCGPLDGKVEKIENMEEGVNAPPMHPNCRCTTIPHYGTKLIESTRAARNDVGATIHVDSKTTWDDWHEEQVANAAARSELAIETKSDMIKTLTTLNVEHRPITERERPLNPTEATEYVGGGDLTQGSCASVGLAYVGNRAGYDVLDYRDGESRSFFATNKVLQQIAKLDGVKGYIEQNASDLKAVGKLVKNMEVGKEYYLATGKHAAIIRKTEAGGYEYLELQSTTSNGFHPLNNDVLRRRFRAASSHTFYGMKLELKSILIDTESLYNNDEFKQLLGFINTAEELQKKGKAGFAK